MTSHSPSVGEAASGTMSLFLDPCPVQVLRAELKSEAVVDKILNPSVTSRALVLRIGAAFPGSHGPWPELRQRCPGCFREGMAFAVVGGGNGPWGGSTIGRYSLTS